MGLHSSPLVSTAAKRLSSRERVYIRWARPVVIAYSRHRWVSSHTRGRLYACTVVHTYRLRTKWDLSSDGYEVHPPPFRVCFYMQIFNWTACLERLTREPSAKRTLSTWGSRSNLERWIHKWNDIYCAKRFLLANVNSKWRRYGVCHSACRSHLCVIYLCDFYLLRRECLGI